MLVIVSDLHLCDEASSTAGAIELLAERLGELAMRASWRADGRYRPVDRVDLVLLGDTLDLTRSRRWLASDARPWSGTDDPVVAETAAAVLDGVLRTNARATSILRALGAEGVLRLPPATSQGQPVYQAERFAVPVLTHYVVGEADWMLCARGPAYDLLRQKVVHHLGLANVYNQPFPHDPTDDPTLLETLRLHRVLARHGDVFDPLAFHEIRENSSVGETLALEVVAPFQIEIENRLAGELPTAFLTGLNDLRHVRPLWSLPAYLDAMLAATELRASIRKEIKDLWDRLVDRWLESGFARPTNGLVGADITGALALRLRFPRLADSMASKSMTSWEEAGPTAAHAMAEADLRNRRASHVVYGHTHAATTAPLEISHAEGFVLQQTYFNAGTWQRVFRPTLQASGRRDFAPIDALTLLTFFAGDERGGRPFEMWTGSLGVVSGETLPTHDATRGRLGAGRAFSPAHTAPPAPHFLAPTSAPQGSPARRR